MLVDLFLVYQFVRRLATSFEKWDAFKEGVIDKDGKILIKKKDRTRDQKKTFGLFDLMVLNMKKLLGKLPGGSSKIASYAAALFLIKEYKVFTDESMLTEDMSEEDLTESISIFNDLYVNYTMLAENVNINMNEAVKKVAVPSGKNLVLTGKKKLHSPLDVVSNLKNNMMKMTDTKVSGKLWNGIVVLVIGNGWRLIAHYGTLKKK